MKDIEGFDLKGNLTPEQALIYSKCVTHWFDTDFNGELMSLSETDRRRFYQMVTDYPDIFIRIFPKGGPLFEYVYYGDEWYSAKRDNHEGIDWDYDCAMVAEYKKWFPPVTEPRGPHIPKYDEE